MLNFDGNFNQLNKKITKDKKEVTNIKIETITFDDEMELKKQLPEVAEYILARESNMMKKAEFEMPIGQSLTLTSGDEEISVEPITKFSLKYKLTKNQERVFIFDLTFKTGENKNIDSFIGHFVNITL